MFRSFFIRLSKAEWAKNLIMGWEFSWKMAKRFIAGEHLEDAISVIRTLNEKGIAATLDHLGEHTVTEADAEQATTDILAIFDAISHADLRSNVSIKLSQIGLNLGEDLCAQNLQRILAHARARNNFLRIDMEDATTVDVTLRLHDAMRTAGFDNFGLVIQSYLYRSEADIERLMQTGTTIRLCKGAYKEPPHVAFPKKADVDRNYDLLTQKLMDASQRRGTPKVSPDWRFPGIPGLATHDEKRIAFAKQYAEHIQLPKAAYEFQMLYGIRRDLQQQLAADGYGMRVYVPYGTQWYPYFMRRLAERPANVWFILSNFFRA